MYERNEKDERISKHFGEGNEPKQNVDSTAAVSEK